MIQQLGLPMIFVTFTSTERLWDPFTEALHTLHASRLNLPNNIKKPPISSYDRIDTN